MLFKSRMEHPGFSAKAVTVHKRDGATALVSDDNQTVRIRGVLYPVPQEQAQRWWVSTAYLLDMPATDIAPVEPVEPLHLVTQRGQPYGSRRRCCERCGRMCWPGMPGSATRWTEDPDTFDAAEDRCTRIAARV